jgi:hypothetical protein
LTPSSPLRALWTTSSLQAGASPTVRSSNARAPRAPSYHPRHAGSALLASIKALNFDSLTGPLLFTGDCARWPEYDIVNVKVCARRACRSHA